MCNTPPPLFPIHAYSSPIKKAKKWIYFHYMLRHFIIPLLDNVGRHYVKDQKGFIQYMFPFIWSHGCMKIYFTTIHVFWSIYYVIHVY